ncbi:hypothetical protein [Streptomyces sp. NPDC019224]|uniref:hypothetical protein n=1 Tax=Streptomyces sp. NPDC019224 TaxID=3154484 RepID=UPI0033DAD879
MRRNRKLYVPGPAVAAALATTACEPGLERMAAVQDNGQLKGRRAPQFHFRTNVPDGDPNSMPDGEHLLIYLYQIIGGT